MPDTRTERLMKIADDLESEGLYTAANSVRAITEERDHLVKGGEPSLVDAVARAINPQAFVAFDKHGRKTNAMQYAVLQATWAIGVCATWLEGIEHQPRPRPTIAELERLLADESSAPIHINPDGSVRVGPSRYVQLLRDQIVSSSHEAVKT